jgi:hypothetical protein
MGRLLRDGSANALAASLASVVPAGFLAIVRARSTDEAAVVGVGFAIYAVVFSGLLGLSQAVQVLASRFSGEGRSDLMAASVRAGASLSLPLAVGTATLLWIGPAGIGLVVGPRHPGSWWNEGDWSVVFGLLGVHVFGHAVWVNFSAGLRSVRSLGFLIGSNLLFSAALLGTVGIAARLGAGLGVLMGLLCLYVAGLGMATLIRFEQVTRESRSPARPAACLRATAGRC